MTTPQTLTMFLYFNNSDCIGWHLNRKEIFLRKKKTKTATKLENVWHLTFQVKSIDDTSNFDDFPEVDLKIRKHLIIMDTTIPVIILTFWNILILPQPQFSHMSFLQIFPLLQNHFNLTFAFCPPVALSNSDTGQLCKDFHFNWNFHFHFHWNIHFHFHWDSTFPLSAAPSNNDTGQPYKDWVFINYTFKRFEGLTQRGPPVKMAKEVVAPLSKWTKWHFWTLTTTKFSQHLAKFPFSQRRLNPATKVGEI